ncbi:alpha/beta fold hydrolase [Crocinitomix catalasitica]|uniref:alpha/beta fold hydrolase n=1 Tax=Crocinitomix catalasitica TaxID=184607 RepID=UPI0004823791|nr:alpha/beta fold hydrolase [Crocinitomix catalasitica]
MKLHYRKIGEGEPLIILHGLFGSADNWQTLGKKFAEHFTVYFVDQRNHGHSPHSDSFSYDLMVADLKELVDDLGLDKFNLLGHSMGGKTAIGFAALYPERIDRMVVADIGHKKYPLHHDAILGGLNSIDLSVVKSRGAADKILADSIPEIGVRQFLLKNLYWVEKGQLGWRINIPVLTREIESIVDAIEFDRIVTNTLFMRGGKSNYIVASDFEDIKTKFPNSTIYTIEESGHWIHAEAPEEFYNTVLEFLL